MPKIENIEENDTSATRVTRSLRKRVTVNDTVTDSPKKNPKSSVAKMSKEAEKDQEKDLASTAMSESRRTRSSRSDSPLTTTKPEESAPKTPARRITRRASATEDLAVVSTPTRRSRRISHDDVNILKGVVDKPLTRSRRTPVPISEETEPVERDEAPSPGIRTRSMTVSPHPPTSSRRNSRPERCKTPTSKKKDEIENVSKEEEETKDDSLPTLDETKEPTEEEQSREEKILEQEDENKADPPKEEEKTESKSMEESSQNESKCEIDSKKEMKATDDSPDDKTDESGKSSEKESSTTLDNNETNESSSKEATVEENKTDSTAKETEISKDEPQNETASKEGDENPQPVKGVSFQASTQDHRKSPARYPKTPIASKSRSYLDTERKENLTSGEKALEENFCMDTSDIPVEVSPSSTETPKLGLKRCLSAMTSSTPIDTVKKEKILKNTNKEKLEETGSILPGTPDEEDASMEEKSDTRAEEPANPKPATHTHEEPKPSTSKSEAIEVKIPKRSINFDAETYKEAGKVSETDATMDVVLEQVEDVMQTTDKMEDCDSSMREVSEDIPNTKEISKEKESNQQTSSEKEAPEDDASSAGTDQEKQGESLTSSVKITDEKANESDSNEMVIDANDDDTVEMDSLVLSKKTQVETKENSPQPETSGYMRQIEEKTDLKEKNSSMSGIAAKDDESQKSSPFSKSWSHAVKGTPALDGKNFIDGLGVLDKKVEKVIHSEKKSANASLLSQQEEEDLLGEEEYYEEEEEEEKCDFIDDEVEENSQDSMDSSEREYLKQNEIPEDGESIGSDDTESIAEDEDNGEEGGEEEEEEEDNESFIVSDGEEPQFSVDTDEDDLLINKKNKNKTKKKERKRIRPLDDTTEEEDETVDKSKNYVTIPEKIEDNTKDSASELPEKGDGVKDSETNKVEPRKEDRPTVTEPESTSKGNEPVVEERTGEEAEENPSQAVSSTEDKKTDDETSQNVDKNVNRSEEVSKDKNESSVEMESTTPFDASVIEKSKLPERMEEESIDDVSPSQELGRSMDRLCVERETAENQEVTKTPENTAVVDNIQPKVSHISREIASESASGKKGRNNSNGSNSSADDERSGNEQIKTKKIENQKKMKVTKDQQEKSNETSDSDTIIFKSTLLAASTSKPKKDLRNVSDKTRDIVEVQEENPNDKQISNNKKKKKQKEIHSSTQIDYASSSKSKEPASETAEVTESETSNDASPPAKEDKNKKTRTVEDASKYDSILLRCEQILRTHEEIKKKAREENKPKKVKKNKKKKDNEETNVLESKNHEVVQTAPKQKQSLDEPKSKNLKVVQQNSDDYQGEEETIECTNTAAKAETNRKSHLFSMVDQQNKNIPNIHSTQDIHKIKSASGIFSEETLFSPEKYSRLPEDIKYKLKELLEPYKFDCIVEKCNYMEHDLENFDFLYIPRGRTAQGKVQKSKLKKKSSMKPKFSSQLLQRKNLQQAFLDDLRFRQWTSLFYQNASNSKMSRERKVKRKRLSIDDNSLEEKAPKKKKRLNILKIISSSGAFKEEPLTSNAKQENGFIESDIQMPTTIGKKVKSILKTDEFEYTKKKTKKIKRKLEISEPMTLLPKPKWTSSGEFTVTKLSNPENSSRILKQVGSATEFYVEPLKVKKRKLDADVEHRAMEFKKSALYNNDRVKRESSKQLLQRKKRQEVYNYF